MALLVAIYGVYHTREQTKMMRAQAATPPSASHNQQQRWWLSRPVVAMVALVLLAWVPTFLAWWNAPPPQAQTIGWGVFAQRPNTGYIAADTTALIAKYKAGYRLIGVAYHNFGTIDQNDITTLSKSAPYEIAGSNMILIPYSKDFMDELAAGAHTTTYILMMVPRALGPDSFSTIREALSVGAILEGGGAGPP